MIILTSVNRKLEMVLAGAITTNDLQAICHFETVRAEEAQEGYGCEIVESNDTTAVTILSAPRAGESKLAKSISIYNADTTDVTMTFRYNDNGTSYTIFKATLATGDNVYYEDQAGWSVLDSTGSLK